MTEPSAWAMEAGAQLFHDLYRVWPHENSEPLIRDRWLAMVRALDAAHAAGRNEGLEEAAKRAVTFEFVTTRKYSRDLALDIADTIRALKTPPPGPEGQSGGEEPR